MLAHVLTWTALLTAADWSEPVVVRWGDMGVVFYRARIEGDALVIEAAHAPGWHTYALDNVERARARSGKEKPETELPTRIAVSGGVEVVGNWFQSEPKDLSDGDIKWYTWGFEGTARFAARVRRIGDGPVTVTIRGQACNDSSCAMVEGAKLTVPVDPAGESAAYDFTGMVEAVPSEQ